MRNHEIIRRRRKSEQKEGRFQNSGGTGDNSDAKASRMGELSLEGVDENPTCERGGDGGRENTFAGPL